jgi:hypothetical protein
MAVRGTVADTAPARHSMRVAWFQRDPGGTTIFVAPAGDGDAPLEPVTEHGNNGGGAPC